ncbi:MAG: trehalase family glycosidase [Planctomycetota bacterium]
MNRATSLVVALAIGTVGAQELHHVDPTREAQVPISGWPTYVENLTVGSPVADFGSHAGVKASVTFDAPVPAHAFLNTAHYSGFQAVASQVDQSFLFFAEGERALLAPAAQRRVEFHPWGWEETALGDGLVARGAVTTLATDVFLITARITNLTPRTRTLSPRLGFLDDGDGIHEGMHPLHLSGIRRWSAKLRKQTQDVELGFRRGTWIELFAWDRQRFARRIASSPAPVKVRRGLEPFVKKAGRWARTIELEARTLGPGASMDVGIVIGCGARDDEAVARLAATRAAVERPWAALEGIRAGWARDLAALPTPHVEGADAQRIYQLAYTGLRMNRYAPRDRLQATFNTAAKIHFNAFYVWDVAIAALGESNWDPALARGMLGELFRAQLPEGHLHYAVGPDQKPVSGFIRGTSQPPIHGWVVERVRERSELDEAQLRPWLEEIYGRSRDYLEFFDRKRDQDGDRIYGFKNALETGWDDTPRYPGLHPAPEINLFGKKVVLGNLSGLLPVKNVEALDLNAWLTSYYSSMGRWAEDLGRPAEAAEWRERSRVLAQEIDDQLWDPVTQSYRDLSETKGERTHVRVDTPVVAWPLFQGIARDPERIRAVVEGYLLNPDKAFGDPDDPQRPWFPVPSVAYDDPEYDHELDGYYWRGQSWLVPAYAACEALFKYGWEDESRELRRRLLRGITKAHTGGIYETYDALSSRIGFGSGSLTGAGEPAAFLIGLSTGPVSELLLSRHERERLVKPTDARVEGYVHDVRELVSDRPLLEVAFAPRAFVPLTRFATRDGAPLLAPSAAGFELELTDPAGNLPAGPTRVTLYGRAGWSVYGEGQGPTVAIRGQTVGPDLVLELERTDQSRFARYRILPPGASLTEE